MVYEIIDLKNKVKRFFYIQYLKRKLQIKKQTFYVYDEGFIRGFNNIKIGDHFAALRGLRIEAIAKQKNNTPIISIGDYVSIGDYCHIAGSNSITIGNGVLIGSHVLITDHQHGKTGEQIDVMPEKRNLYSKGPVVIEDHVWIGDHVVIMPGVHIGNSSIIGANTVVTHDVPAHTVVAGTPARVIKNI